LPLGAARIVALTLLLAGCRFDPTPVQQPTVVASFPHDRAAFTEGLFFQDGYLYESSGLVGRSSVRRFRLGGGAAERVASVPPEVFLEGIAPWGDQVVGVSWRNGVGFRWRSEDLGLQSRFAYPGRAWGLTEDGRSLILSDGSPTLRFLDPATFVERRRITVTAGGRPVRRLNELEWVDGEIFANVWRTDRIARIDPSSGHVRAWIDLSAVAYRDGDREDVLNGIAYDARGKRLFVTGKRWPRLLQIRVPPVGQ